MRLHYSATLFVSALLLFLVQPMVGKMLLPTLGGTPAVWNTCMLFFQVVLLGGYTYAHLLTTRLSIRWQVLVHGLVLLGALALLPLRVAEGAVPPSDANPILWILTSLTTSVGLPFFALAASAPLLQKWFSRTGDPAAGDPYFLYAASNLGSMLALLGYPALVEPSLSLRAAQGLSQTWLWTAGYGLLIVMIGGCAAAVWRTRPAPQTKPDESGPVDQTAAAPTLSQKLLWVVLALAPSSLMLGATTFITTDIAALPLLWVVPLALYLLSFILVFARWPQSMHTLAVRLLPLAILALVAAQVGGGGSHQASVILLHLGTLFLAALVCHGEMARSRPPARYLTQFYWLMSLGGALGGVFNALIAPLVFRSVAEYPIALVLVCLLLPRPGDRKIPSREASRWTAGIDVACALALGLLAYGLIVLFAPAGDTGAAPGWGRGILEPWLGRLGLNTQQQAAVDSILAQATPAVLCYLFVARPLRFGLGVAAVLLATTLTASGPGTRTLHQERSFFGVHRVLAAGEIYTLMHGTTLHGKQIRTAELRREAQTYYHPTGPIGQVFTAFHGSRRKDHVGLIGLGAGALASYGERGQRMTFYEIDPAVGRIASDSDNFTYLADCAADWSIVLGDGRIRLAQAPDDSYGLLVLDAFSSDAIPVHLLTREALQLYLQKLGPQGVLAVHISNRYLDLEPVVANLARDLGLAALTQHDGEVDPAKYPGKTASEWMIVARRQEDFGTLAADPRWQPAREDPAVGVWTDDYSNLVRLLLWRKR